MLYRTKFRRSSGADAGPKSTEAAGAVHPRRRLFGGGRQFYTQMMPEVEPGGNPDPDRSAGKPGRSSGGSAWEFGIEGRHDPDRIRDQVRRGANIDDPVGGGGGTLFTEAVLVVNQRAKLIEVAAEFAVYDQHGKPLGSVVQVGQSTTKKVARFIGRLDQFFTHTLEVHDVEGAVLLRLTRPRKMVKSTIVVERGDGQQVGEIRQDNVFGAITFSLSADGVSVGAIRAENVLAWDFSVVDASDNEVARISKTWAGWDKAALTNADQYVVQIPRRLPDPLATLVVAASLSIDLALKQDDKGFSVSDLLPW
ncbi:scramblase family protein [Rhodococcus opacus]|uniref:Scramblase family protein n=1 Tax=Rhodococcus opacus TaxID=37919 RepID=A0A1B1KEZ0_RHOOP|nr:phospholipid scramblase-related protein [Rhodococcus opacus]ANS31181.1 scramblase family protein [Rhodococcus opacus]